MWEDILQVNLDTGQLFSNMNSGSTKLTYREMQPRKTDRYISWTFATWNTQPMQNSRKNWKSLPSAGCRDLLKGPFRCWQCRSLNLDYFLPNQKCLFRERERENFRPLAANAHCYLTLSRLYFCMDDTQARDGRSETLLCIFVFWTQFSTSSLFGHALQGQIPIDTLTSKNCAVEKRAKYVPP